MAGNDSTLLVIGAGEPLLDGLTATLGTMGVQVERATTADGVQVAAAVAPDVIVLVGDAADVTRSDVLLRLHKSRLAATIPVAVLTGEQGLLEQRLRAYEGGAAAVLPRTASVHETAQRIVGLVDSLPSESAQGGGGQVGEASLDEFVQMLGTELRNGILSVRAKEGDDIRLVLGEGRDVAKLVNAFVARMKQHVSSAEVVQYELIQQPKGTLSLLDSDLVDDDSVPSLQGVGIVLADEDVVRVDAVSQALRELGARVVVSDLSGASLDRARELDPVAFIIGEEEVQGRGFQAAQTMRSHPRLRWAGTVALKWDEVWKTGDPSARVERLAGAIAKLTKPEEEFRAKLESGKGFDSRLEFMGPARLLRALAADPRSRRLVAQTRDIRVQVDVAEGLIVGAKAMRVGKGSAQGANALAVLLRLRRARLKIAPLDVPEVANVMAPVDEALNQASPAVKVAPASEADARTDTEETAAAEAHDAQANPLAYKPPVPGGGKKPSQSKMAAVGAPPMPPKPAAPWDIKGTSPASMGASVRGDATKNIRTGAHAEPAMPPLPGASAHAALQASVGGAPPLPGGAPPSPPMSSGSSSASPLSESDLSVETGLDDDAPTSAFAIDEMGPVDSAGLDLPPALPPMPAEATRRPPEPTPESLLGPVVPDPLESEIPAFTARRGPSKRAMVIGAGAMVAVMAAVAVPAFLSQPSPEVAAAVPPSVSAAPAVVPDDEPKPLPVKAEPKSERLAEQTEQADLKGAAEGASDSVVLAEPETAAEELAEAEVAEVPAPEATVPSDDAASDDAASDDAVSALPPMPDTAKPVSPRDVRAATKLLRRAARYERTRRYSEALEILDAAMARNPADDAVPAIVARVHFRQRDFGKAVQWINRAIDLESSNDMHYLFRGDALAANGQVKAARESWRKAIEMNPRNRPAKKRLRNNR